MSVDPRTPVIIGVAQVSQTPATDDEHRAADDAITLMSRAVDAAAGDTGATAGAGAVLAGIDTFAVVAGLWRYRDPASLVAHELGLHPSRTILTTFGGQIPIHVAAELADRIRAGRVEIAVLAGGENNLSRRALARLGVDPSRRAERRTDVETWGPPLDMGDPSAVARGGEMPRNSYAVVDSALRVRRGETLDAARDRAAALWAGYAAVAADNPHAADRRGLTAEAIREPSPDNRFVSWPYTKAMCANNNVDHAGAIIMATTEAADRLGVPTDRRVHPHLCVTAADTASLLARDELGTAPGLAAAVEALRRENGPTDEIELLDLYSCFPAVVTLTADLLGVDPSRPLTVTGGLAFAGAPLNFAAGESLIGMVARLRENPGAHGLVQGNGGHISKHALGLYSTTPPTGHHRIVAASHDAPQRAFADPDRSDRAVLDGVTVDYGRDGPERAIGVARFGDGSRTWVTSTDPSLMEEVMSEECVGHEIAVDTGTFSFGRPSSVPPLTRRRS